jgi:hypothetical protein
MRCFPYCLKLSVICRQQMTAVQPPKPKYFFIDVYCNSPANNKYMVNKQFIIFVVNRTECPPIKPMMSAILVSHVKSLYLPPKNQVIMNDDSEDEDYEPMHLRVAVDHDGNLMTTNQFHNYYYRGSSLQSMNFFDFARSIKLEKKINAPRNTTETCAMVLST